MKSVYKDYVEFLKSFVHDRRPEIKGKIDYVELRKLAKINSTEGIINYIFMKNPDLSDSEYQGYMKKQFHSEIALYSRKAELLKVLVAELNKEGIDHILFKGAVVRDYYTVPELRTFSDIDFVIRKDDRKKCDKLMKVMGYESQDNWEPVYSYLRGTEYYEIHTDVMEVDVSDRADYKLYYSHIWEHVIQNMTEGKEHSYEFKPEFHFLYMLTHIAKHISSSGAGIRMYLDIAFFIKHFRNTIDWKWIYKELKKLQFREFANITLTAVEQWFDVKSPLPLKKVSEVTMKEFLSFTIEGGVYGKYGRDKNVVFLKQQNRNVEKISKFRTLLFHVFPPVSSLKFQYSYLQKCSWLLPVAWIHRILGNRSSWKRYAQYTKGIMTADTNEAVRLKRIYKEIGL